MTIFLIRIIPLSFEWRLGVGYRPVAKTLMSPSEESMWVGPS